MTTNTQNHLKSFLESVVPNTVFLAPWLENIGISRDLQQYYKRSGWISQLGAGAFIRPQDNIDWLGGVYALQTQANLPIHPGGLISLVLQGYGHYIRFGGDKINIFINNNITIPKWFIKHDWGRVIEYHPSRFLPENLSLIKYNAQGFQIDISSAERAIIECLYLTPGKMDLVECFYIMEGLVNLRPTIVQELLEKCRSIKVKRLFLYMAEKSSQAWLKYVDKSKINLGSGDRSLVKHGVYIKDYGITVPQELAKL